ncbi:MAG: MerR family transcriptional regulator [Acidobacteria bacterium]|nr:MerR family transcriptional regulator [Acidobacteriota bacterium]
MTPWIAGRYSRVMNDDFNAAGKHSMGAACELTGLTPDVIRAWERRYRAVTPDRTVGNQRTFTDQDIGRLKLLREVTRVGRSISKVAHLSDEELVDLVHQDRARLSDAPRPQLPSEPLSRLSILLQRCLEAVERLDVGAFQRQLELAVVQLGWHRAMDDVLVPLLAQIGELWDHGDARDTHERFATSLVRSCVGSLRRAYVAAPTAPGLVVAAPAGQQHELGALLVAATAAAEGWQVSYLGADVAIDDIAMEVLETEYDVIALSLTQRADGAFEDELRRLRRLLGSQRTLIVGGQGAGAHAELLRAIGAVRPGGLSELRDFLERLRDETAAREEVVFHHPLAGARGTGGSLRHGAVDVRASIR